MYPKHRLAYTKEISGEIDFKCRNMQKYFPNSDHVWVVDMKKIDSSKCRSSEVLEINFLPN